MTKPEAIRGDGYEIAKWKRANSPKFQRLCAKSLEWQSTLDAKRHTDKVEAAKNRRFGK